MLSLRLHVVCAVVPALLWLTPTASAQDVAVTTTPVSIVPHVIRYSGTLPDAPSSASVVDVTFSLYENQTGGDPLWTEKQTVALDPTSKYTVLLGSQTQLGLPP